MNHEFEMSMMRELIFFLGFQIKQMKDDIFISQTKYAKELVKKFCFDCKINKIFMATNAKLDVDEEENPTDIYRYRVMIGSFLSLTAIGGVLYFLYVYVQGSNLIPRIPFNYT
jgi:hypothetical protein